MTKQEMLDLNAELIDLLAAVRDQIDDKLEEIAAVAEEAAESGDYDLSDQED